MNCTGTATTSEWACKRNVEAVTGVMGGIEKGRGGWEVGRARRAGFGGELGQLQDRPKGENYEEPVPLLLLLP